jgi:hypothetical protein
MRNPAKSRDFDDGLSKHAKGIIFLERNGFQTWSLWCSMLESSRLQSTTLFTQAVCPVQYRMRKHPTLIIAQKEITSPVYFSRCLTSLFLSKQAIVGLISTSNISYIL